MPAKVFLSTGLLAIAAASLVACYLAGHPVDALLFNSDAVLFPRLFYNLDGGGSLNDWYLTPAPYFFPDYIIFFVAYSLGETAYTQIIIFAVLQTGLTWAASYFLARQVVRQQAFLVATLVTVLMVWLALNAGQRADPFVYLLLSGYHYGGFLVGMVFIALVLRYFNVQTGKQKWLILVSLCVLAFLSALSDNLFLIQVLIPLFASLCLVNVMAREKTAVHYLPAIIPLLFGIAGSKSYSTLVANKTRYPFTIKLKKVAANVGEYYAILQDFFFQNPVFGAGIVLFIAFGLLCLSALVKRRLFLNLPKDIIQVIIFALFAIGSTLGAVLLITSIAATNRYLLTLFVWPVMIGAMVAAYWLKDKFFYFSSAVSLAAVITLGVNAFLLVAHNGTAKNYYPSDIACLDAALAEEQLTQGIAQYWDAKQIEAFSRNGLTLAQYMDNLDEMRWLTSKKFFKPTYDFAIVSENAQSRLKISKEKLFALNGDAKKTIACGNRTLLIYGKAQMKVR